jgi:hypothetical protein
LCSLLLCNIKQTRNLCSVLILRKFWIARTSSTTLERFETVSFLLHHWIIYIYIHISRAPTRKMFEVACNITGQSELISFIFLIVHILLPNWYLYESYKHSIAYYWFNSALEFLILFLFINNGYYKNVCLRNGHIL